MGRRKKRKKPKLAIKPDTLYSIVAVVLMSLGALIMVSFSGQGALLSAINQLLAQKLGFAMMLLPFILIASGMVMLQTKWAWSKPHVLLGAIFMFLATLGLFQQGEIGQETFANVSHLVTPVGAVVIFMTFYVVGGLIMLQLSIPELAELLAKLKPKPKVAPEPEVEPLFADESNTNDSKGKGFSLPKLSLGMGKKKTEEPGFSVNDGSSQTFNQDVEDGIAVEPKADGQAGDGGELGEGTVLSPDASQLVWDYPHLSLLDASKGGEADRGDVKKNAQIIEATLDSFGIKAKVIEVNYGPSVTQYALDITRGTKLSRITNLATDLALALAAPTGQVRIEAPIPGRSLVGIEVPNLSSQYVTLRTMLGAKEMKKHKSKLAVALGIDVAGQPVVADITKMPHVLIAGATGSGKSVCVNSFMTSILFRASPAEVKFILVDPKRVELTGYNGIPHLLTPVIVDPPKVVSALKWAAAEMDRRYKKLAEAGVKNIEGYNELAGFAAMPNIVIVIDELADIMLFAPSEVEESITRIAQMARAVGIHLVLATQRPSVDVITGLIKANVPTRIAFAVSSQTDSRVVLDGPGAEKLLGKGDMLYIPPTQSKPSRIQGTFVSEGETKQLIDFIKSQGLEPKYEDEITTKFQSNTIKGGSGGAGGEDRDDLFMDAVKLIAQYDKASSSMIQRRLSVGYARAARILDQLFEAGLVSPPNGSKPREVNSAKVSEFLGSLQAVDQG